MDDIWNVQDKSDNLLKKLGSHLIFGTLYSFSRVPIIKYHRLHGLNNRNLFLHSSGDCKSENQGVPRVGFFRSFSLWIVDGHLLQHTSNNSGKCFINL